MRELGALVVAVTCALLVLFGLGIVVCGLVILTGGNMLVLTAGAGVAIPFAFYCGYRAAKAVLGWTPPVGPAPKEPSDAAEDT